ncbi:MAG: hypothetical protein GX443_12795 [Deltaproteobacteria bacterium]|nr:hypothetical protein [Deltaproteobacteria bacterium]
MAAAAIALAVASVNMLRKVEPFFSYFYCFAWWSYIVGAEAYLYRKRGSSPVVEEPGRYLLHLPFSVTLWLLFEVFNFRLANWQYVNVVEQVPQRWLGYWVSFATVLPGLFVTQRLLDHLGVACTFSVTPLKSAERLCGPLIAAGALMLFLPLLWPRCFFPLLWLAFIFLVEPFNYKFGGESLLRELQGGDARRILLLALSGAICGFLWEFWNYWAGSKWVYTIPFLDFLKVFEMPLLGFLGFPPFAVECYVMANACFLLLGRAPWRSTRRLGRSTWIFGGIFLLFLHLLVFRGIDHFTVASFRR